MRNPVTLPLFILIITAFLLNMGCNAQNRDEKQNLKGGWKFILGDDMKFADPKYDDSDWEKIRVPAAWEDEGFRNYDGFAWYRKTFELDIDDVVDPLFLHLGTIDDVDEVFLNGERIGGMGSFPPNFLTAWNQNRTYQIPLELIKKKGQNVIAVRVYDDEQEGGIIGWNVGIYNFGGFSQSSVNLMGKWKFSIENQAESKSRDFDDSSWNDVMVPATWESQGYRDYDGYAWYRKSFTLPADQSTSSKILILGRIDDIDETYVNGILVGSTGRMDRQWVDGSEYRKSRTYYLADHLLEAGKENVIAVKVYDHSGEGGIYEGPISIIDTKDYKEFWREYYRNSSQYHRWVWSFIEE